MKDNCKNNPYASYDFSVKAPKEPKASEKSTVRRGTDLRSAGNKK